MSRCNDLRFSLYVSRIDSECLARPVLRRLLVLLCDLLLCATILAVGYACSLGLGLAGTALLAPDANLTEPRNLWLMTPALGFFLLLLAWIATLLCSAVYHDHLAPVRHESSE